MPHREEPEWLRSLNRWEEKEAKEQPELKFILKICPVAKLLQSGLEFFELGSEADARSMRNKQLNYLKTDWFKISQ